MITAFIDASVLFAASLSRRGASSEILRQGASGNIVLVISDLVLEEVRRNLSKKRLDAIPIFEELSRAIPFQVVHITKQEILHAARYTALKDAPIVAAARKARVDYLVSLDRQHLVGIPEVATRMEMTAFREGRSLRPLPQRALQSPVYNRRKAAGNKRNGKTQKFKRTVRIL